jgi:hypothetical protein
VSKIPDQTYYFVDPQSGDPFEQYDTLEEAVAAANESIEYTRQNMDGEWPLEVEDLTVYRAPVGCEYPDEDGVAVAKAVMVDVVTKPDDCEPDGYSPSLGLSFASVDFYCNYRVEPVEAAIRQLGESHE